MLIPRKKVPDLRLPLLGGGRFDLAAESAGLGTVLVFYRGLHCSICARQLTEIEGHVEDFATRGVSIIAVSSDGEDRARGMAEKVGASRLRFAYDLPIAQARDWGLYISTGRGMTPAGFEEPALFSEPGMFMVTPQQTLYFGMVQTMPFVRPKTPEILAALDVVIAKNYPARGEYTAA